MLCLQFSCQQDIVINFFLGVIIFKKIYYPKCEVDHSYYVLEKGNDDYKRGDSVKGSILSLYETFHRPHTFSRRRHF